MPRSFLENIVRGHVTSEEWAVVVITAAATFIPEFVDDHSCPGPAHLYDDVAKMFYFAMIVPAAIAAVTLKHILLRNKDQEFKRKVNLVTVSMLLSTQTWIFLSSMIPAYISSDLAVILPLSVVAFLFSAWNLFCTGYHLLSNRDFKQGSIDEMKQHISGWRLAFASFFEANFRGATFAATINLIIANILMNLIYDTQHNNTPVWMNPVVLSLTFVAYLIGSASVVNDRFGSVLFFMSGMAASFYSGLLPWLTIADCIKPGYFWKAGFVKEGLAIVLPLAIYALLKSACVGVFATEDPYEAEGTTGWKNPIGLVKTGVTSCCSRLFQKCKGKVAVNPDETRELLIQDPPKEDLETVGVIVQSN